MLIFFEAQVEAESCGPVDGDADGCAWDSAGPENALDQGREIL